MNIENALKIDGWMHPIELKWLARIASISNIIIESGCFKGRSTRALVDNCEGIVYAVDPWPPVYIQDNGNPLLRIGDPTFELFKKNLSAPEIKSKLIIFRGDLSDLVLPPSYVDFIFLDGDHRYDAVIKDINSAKRFLKPKGILAGHDYTHKDWPGVKKAVDELYPNANIIESIWWTDAA